VRDYFIFLYGGVAIMDLPKFSDIRKALTRRNFLRATAAASLAASNLWLPPAARAGAHDDEDFPGMGEPGAGLTFDDGPSPKIHRPNEPNRFQRGAFAEFQQRRVLQGAGEARKDNNAGIQDLGTIDNVLWGTGLYVGNEWLNWSEQTLFNVIAQVANWGFYFITPKVGGYGYTWYGSDDQLRSWRDAAWSYGIGFAPFIYSVPNSRVRDAQICSEIANAVGVAIVDMEDEWANAYSAMTEFGNVFRSYNPYDAICVTGYGDPITRFGRGNFPSQELAAWADGYMPQWYYGVWSVYNQSGVRAAINWADNECGIEFGWSFPMCPNFSIYTIYHGRRILSATDISSGEEYGWNWNAPIIWWEYSDMNADLAWTCLN